MRKIIGLINNDIKFNHYDIYGDDSRAIGGSETSTIQLANEISKNNDYHVIVFSNTPWYLIKDNLEYVPFSMFKQRCQYQYFDAMLIIRFLDNIYDIIKETKCCDNVYTLSHDLLIYEKAHYTGIAQEIFYDKHYDRINGIKKHFVLSKYHYDYYTSEYKFPNDSLSIIGDGIDLDLFNDIDIYNTNRDHNIFWSIRFERNFDILVDKIYPLVKKEIPDCKIYACSYDVKLNEKYINNSDIINLGSLTKTELYKERVKHATLFYHPEFNETFGITILEAIMCGNDIVMTDLYGPSDILYPYKEFLLPNDVNYFDNDEHCQLAANMIIESILNYNDPQKIKLRNSMRNYIIKNYNWATITKNILKEMDV